MKKLTPKAYEYIDQVVGEVVGGSGVKGFSLFEDGDNPFSFFLEIPLENGEVLAVRTCNELFHALGLLPEGKNLALGELGDYCNIVPPQSNGLYLAAFNHPAVFALKETDPEYRFVLKNWRDWDEDDEAEAEIRALVDGIKAGRLKSKSPDGYLVLKAQFYDAIEAGKKKVEYRDFTEYNLKRTIGIKTIRFNRGYVKNAPQMRWEVEKIVLLDDEDNECDPFNVPEDFWPVTIAIHLGKRIDFNGEQAMTRKETANSKNGGNGLTRKSLSFYKKRTCWYAEVPEHTEAQNQMVSGADVMCETMACGHKRVTIDFLYGEEFKPSSVKCLACLDKIGQTAYGATYRLSSESSTVHLPDTAWLCNVTKTVCDGRHPTHIYITDVRPNDEPPYGRATRRSACKRVHLPWEGRTDLIMSNDEYWRELHKACPPSKEERGEKPLDDMTEEELEASANRYFGRINSKEADKVFERRQLGALKAEYEWEQNGCKGERPENIGSIIAASYNPFWSDAK